MRSRLVHVGCLVIAIGALASPDATAGPSGRSTGGGQIVSQSNPLEAVTFGFNADSSLKTAGRCDVLDHLTGTHVECLDVAFYSQFGTQAVWSGHAQVDGSPQTYQIRVADNAEPGAGADRFSIVTTGGYSVAGTLTQGDIQVHS
jgi:hypothetical protein